MGNTTLSYPSAGSQLARSLATAMRNRELAFFLSASFKLAVGIPLAFVVPLLIAWKALAFWPTLLLTSAITLPILFWLETRSRGRFFEEQAQSLGSDAPASRGEWELRGSILAWAFYIDVLLLAPRLVYGGFNMLRERQAIPLAGTAGAAQIVAALYALNEGMFTDELRQTLHSPADFRASLAYLRLHDWIDLSKSGDRVWLLTRARERIDRLKK